MDPEIGMAARRYIISDYAGNKEAEMLERFIEAIAYPGVGSVPRQNIKDVGRQGKTARGVRRGIRCPSQSYGCVDANGGRGEARKQLSRHLNVRLFDF